VAPLTGGARGIGAAIVEDLLAGGATGGDSLDLDAGALEACPLDGDYPITVVEHAGAVPEHPGGDVRMPGERSAGERRVALQVLGRSARAQ